MIMNERGVILNYKLVMSMFCRTLVAKIQTTRKVKSKQLSPPAYHIVHRVTPEFNINTICVLASGTVIPKTNL